MDINLEKREITLILKGLAKLPYEDSAALIRKIVEQSAKEQTQIKRSLENG